MADHRATDGRWKEGNPCHANKCLLTIVVETTNIPPDVKSAVARELKRKTPFASLEQEILLGLGVAAARTTESMALS